MKITSILFTASIITFGAIQLLPAGETTRELSSYEIINDSIFPPEIEIKPSIIQVDFFPSEFVTTDITILNRGGLPLEIKKIKASCYCANGAVINSYISPFTVGKIRLSFNTVKLTDSLQRIDYTIWSNARDSIFNFPVFLRRKENNTLQNKE